jgi:hypothetical protein
VFMSYNLECKLVNMCASNGKYRTYGHCCYVPWAYHQGYVERALYSRQPHKGLVFLFIEHMYMGSGDSFGDWGMG